MATPNEIDRLRAIADANDQGDYSNGDLFALIDELGVEGAAAELWLRKAAKYAKAVDISEAGSSRKNSDLYTHAMEMARMWGATEDSINPEAGQFSTTRKIERA